MKVLLDVINDRGDIRRRNVGVQSTTCGRFDDGVVMSMADGGLDVGAKQRNHTSFILGGYSARCLTLLALYRARLARRHTLLHDQMIAAEEPAAAGAEAPASPRRFAATRRTLEFERNGEHLSVVLS